MADKLTIVGADWCGWTTKQKKDILSSKHSHMFEYVDCSSSEHKDNKMCQDMKGFPAIKNSKNETCQVGYADPNTDEFHEMMIKCASK